MQDSADCQVHSLKQAGIYDGMRPVNYVQVAIVRAAHESEGCSQTLERSHHAPTATYSSPVHKLIQATTMQRLLGLSAVPILCYGTSAVGAVSSEQRCSSCSSAVQLCCLAVLLEQYCWTVAVGPPLVAVQQCCWAGVLLLGSAHLVPRVPVVINSYKSLATLRQALARKAMPGEMLQLL